MKILDVPQSGSVAGVTSSRNRYGQYRRSRATPVNPNTIAQQDARNSLASFSEAWRGLTDEQRLAWSSYSAEHPVTDSLGQSQILTGHQQFVSLNTALTQAGEAGIDVPPSEEGPDAPVLDITVSTAAAFNMDVTPDPVPDDTALIIDASPPLSPGRTFNKDFRRVLHFPAASVGPALTAADLSAKFGSLAAGQKFFIRARMLTPAGGFGPYASVEVVLT